MRFIYTLWSYSGYALMLIIIYLVWTYLPQFSYASVSSNYHDMKPNIKPYDNVRFDATVNVDRLQRGDLVIFKLGDSTEKRSMFGWVAARPGERVEIRDTKVLVNGVGVEQGGKVWRAIGDRAPVMVPRDHVYLLSVGHVFDSIAYGPVPASAVRGRVESY